VSTVTSEFGNEEDNVESIDVVVSHDVPDEELLTQNDDGDFDGEDSDESDSEEESDDDSDAEFDDEDDDAAEDAESTDYDAQPAASAESSVPMKQTVVIETLPITGEPRVDDALSRLSDLEGLPVHEHGDVFEDVRRRLHGTLSDLSGQ
jgi:hypothetical protein